MEDNLREFLAAVACGIAEKTNLNSPLDSLPLTVKHKGRALTVTIRVKSSIRRRKKKPTQCELHIVIVLSSANQRLTTTRILEEMNRRDMDHGTTTVSHALAKMVKAGIITSSKVSPRGYAMAGFGDD